jgi:hypothetical protein
MIDFRKPPRFVGKMTTFCRQLVWLSALLLVLGCGKPAPKGPQGTVHGKVTVKGSPVPEGTVVSFMGQTSSGGSARIGADGAYRLVGPTGGETIPADTYKVVLMPVAGTSMTSDEAMKLKPEELPKPDSVIPDKYQNANTTPETREVKEGDNEINIDLTNHVSVPVLTVA